MLKASWKTSVDGVIDNDEKLASSKSTLEYKNPYPI